MENPAGIQKAFVSLRNGKGNGAIGLVEDQVESRNALGVLQSKRSICFTGLGGFLIPIAEHTGIGNAAGKGDGFRVRQILCTNEKTTDRYKTQER